MLEWLFCRLQETSRHRDKMIIWMFWQTHVASSTPISCSISGQHGLLSELFLPGPVSLLSSLAGGGGIFALVFDFCFLLGFWSAHSLTPWLATFVSRSGNPGLGPLAYGFSQRLFWEMGPLSSDFGVGSLPEEPKQWLWFLSVASTSVLHSPFTDFCFSSLPSISYPPSAPVLSNSPSSVLGHQRAKHQVAFVFLFVYLFYFWYQLIVSHLLNVTVPRFAELWGWHGNTSEWCFTEERRLTLGAVILLSGVPGWIKRRKGAEHQPSLVSLCRGLVTICLLLLWLPWWTQFTSNIEAKVNFSSLKLFMPDILSWQIDMSDSHTLPPNYLPSPLPISSHLCK